MFGKNKNNPQNNRFQNMNQPGMPPQGGPRPGMPLQGRPGPDVPPQGGPRPGMPPQGGPIPGMPPQGGPKMGKKSKQPKEKKSLFGGLFKGKKDKNNMPPKNMPQDNQQPFGQQFGGQQPPMGQPPMGQPPMGQPPMGQPPMGQPSMGQPPMGQRQPSEKTADYIPPYANQGSMNQNRPEPLGNSVNPPQQGNNPQQFMGNQDPARREYYSKKDSQAVYGEKTMEQNVFMYADKSKFISIQKYVNEHYSGVYMMGTSALGEVLECFKTKLNSRTVILFISNEEEFVGLISFIEFLLNIKLKNPELMSISIVLTKDVRTEIVKNIKNYNALNIYKLDKDLSQLSTDIVDNIMTQVVKNQPTYLKEVEKKSTDRPKQAKRRQMLDVNNKFRVKNIDEIRKEINIDRKLDPEKLYDMVSDSIINLKTEEDIKKFINMVPELSVLNEYSDTLEEYMAENTDDLSPKELSDIVLSKLEVSAVQREVLENIFETLIDYAEKKVSVEDEKVVESNRGLVMRLEDPNELETNMLFERREDIKKKVTQGFEEYKKNVRMISNAIELRKQLYQKVQLKLKPVVSDGVYNQVDNETKDVTAELLVQLEEDKKALDKSRVDVEKKMISTFDYVKSLFRDYNVLITIDDVIIDRLKEDKERALSNSVKKVYRVDNELVARGRFIKLYDQDHFNKLSKVVFNNNFIVITNIEDMEFTDKMVFKNANDFITEDYTQTDVNVVRISDWNDPSKLEDQMNLLINKLKYIGKYFRKVMFVLDENVNEYIENRIIKELADVAIFTDTSKENLIKVNRFTKELNKFTNIYGKTIILNNYDSEKSELTLNEIRTLANIGKGTKEMFVNTNTILKDKKEMTKFILEMRKL